MLDDCLAAGIGAGSWRLPVVIEESRLRVGAGRIDKLTRVGLVCCCSELGGSGESCF